MSSTSRAIPSPRHPTATRLLLAAAVIVTSLASACAGVEAGAGTDGLRPVDQQSRPVDEGRTRATPPSSTEPVRPPLARGDEGTRVADLQRSLRRLGFDPGPEEGRFGPGTEMAVWAFQALAGRNKDGIVTPAVEEAIHRSPALEMLRPDLGPTHTEVDLDRQVLLVWGEGRLELVTHVSTGSGVPYCEGTACGDAVTPEGEFTYQYRIVGERHAALGILHDPVYFDHDGHAVHGDPEVPDHPASHGCVRVPMHISARFQDLVADGEVISLFRSSARPA